MGTGSNWCLCNADGLTESVDHVARGKCPKRDLMAKGYVGCRGAGKRGQRRAFTNVAKRDAHFITRFHL